MANPLVLTNTPVPVSRKINTTAPLNGGGSLATDLNLTVTPTPTPTPTLEQVTTAGATTDQVMTGAGFVGPVTGHASLDLPLTGGTLSGNLTAPTFIGAVTGHSSLDLPLTGGTLSGGLTGTTLTMSGGATFGSDVGITTNGNCSVTATSATATAGFAATNSSGETGSFFVGGSSTPYAGTVGLYTNAANGFGIFGATGNLLLKANQNGNVGVGTVTAAVNIVCSGTFGDASINCGIIRANQFAPLQIQTGGYGVNSVDAITAPSLTATGQVSCNPLLVWAGDGHIQTYAFPGTLVVENLYAFASPMLQVDGTNGVLIGSLIASAAGTWSIDASGIITGVSFEGPANSVINAPFGVTVGGMGAYYVNGSVVIDNTGTFVASGSPGITTTFDTGAGRTVTVTGGIITGITA